MFMPQVDMNKLFMRCMYRYDGTYTRLNFNILFLGTYNPHVTDTLQKRSGHLISRGKAASDLGGDIMK